MTVDIDELHRRVGDLAEWIGARYGVLVGRPSGADTPTECPMHKPGHVRSGSVHRYPDGSTFICWRCDRTPRDVIDLVAWTDGVDRGEAIRRLADELHLDRDDWTPSPRRRPAPPPPPKAPKGPLDVDQLAADRLTGTDADQVLAGYMAARRWPPWIAERYDLHPVRRNGVTRIRHPFTLGDETITAQDYRADASIRWLSVADCSMVPFGLNQATVPDDLPLLDVVEGVSDCLSVAAALGRGHPVVGAPGATAWSAEWSGAFADVVLIVVADNDDAGEKMRARIDGLHSAVGGVTGHLFIPEQHVDAAEWFLASPTMAGDYRTLRHMVWREAVGRPLPAAIEERAA